MDFLKDHLPHLTRSIYQGIAANKPNRLVFMAENLKEAFGEISSKSAELETKVKENYQAEIAKRINELENAKKTPAQIKKALQSEKQNITINAFDKALRDANINFKENGKTIQLTYKFLSEYTEFRGVVSTKAKEQYTKYETQISSEIDSAVDAYFAQKAAASAATAKDLVPALTPSSPDQPLPPEIASLQDVYNKRQAEKNKSKASLAEIKQDLSLSYLSRTGIADSLTDPKLGTISNYETNSGKFWKDATQENNPTRARLRGFLYANDIFAGGGDAGQLAMNEAIKEPYKLYENHFPDKLTAEDLDSGMSMKAYFDQAKSEYSTFERVIGTIAGLRRLAEKNLAAKPDVLQRYLAHLNSKFDELKTPELKDNEEKQLQKLYSIKSISEFLDTNTNWRKDLSKIDHLTDPDSPDAKIDDYPGWGKDNKDNKTRQNLNGYLYAVHLFHEKKDQDRVVNDEFNRAVKMFKSPIDGNEFSQDMIEKESGPTTGRYGYDPSVLQAEFAYNLLTDKRNPQQYFGLGKYLIDAAPHTKHEQVKGVIAGLLKLAKDNEAKHPTYRQYILDKIKDFSLEDSEEMQMTVLSTIQPPRESVKEEIIDSQSKILAAVLAAQKQHPQWVPSKALHSKLSIEDPSSAKPPINLTDLSKEVKTELDQFIVKRSNDALKAMETGFNTLLTNNKALKTPLYEKGDLESLSKSITDNAQEFANAKAITAEPNLTTTVNDGYLSKLAAAEKNHFNIMEELEAKKKAVKDRKENKTPDPDKPLPAPLPTPAEKPAEDDIYKSAWEKAPRVEPVLKNHMGLLTVDSGDDDDKKVTARDDKGNKVGEIANGTQLIRTPEDSKVLARQVEHLNFIRVHRHDDLHNHGLWIPEEQLFPPETFNPTPEFPSASPKLTPNYLDQTFDRLAQQVETNPAGAVFDISYNGQAIKCLAKKQADGYHLLFNSAEAGQGDRHFNSLLEMHKYIENGQFNQLLAMQTIMDRRNWDRYKDEKWFDKVLEFKHTGDWSTSVELDWHGGDILDSGNAKIDLTVGPDGRINYSIQAPHVGPNGENERSGYVWDFTQLSQSILHSKSWSENYTKNYQEEKFPEILAHERLLTELMDAVSFEFLSSKIGQKYYFNHFDNLGYGYMTLNWENHTDLQARNRSLVNPVLEYRLNPDNTINWKLTNLTGPNSTRVGVQGQAVNLNDLANRVFQVKNSPAKMTTPNQNLYNLGNFGHNPL